MNRIKKDKLIRMVRSYAEHCWCWNGRPKWEFCRPCRELLAIKKHPQPSARKAWEEV